MYDKKDIVLLPFPYSDLTGAKQRPALIISNSKLNTTEDRICCLITSKPPVKGILIKKGKLPFKSWVKPHRIFTVNKKIIRKKIGSVHKEFHKRILKEINEFIE